MMGTAVGPYELKIERAILIPPGESDASTKSLQDHNNFRSGDIRVNNFEGVLYADAVPVLLDTCELECDPAIESEEDTAEDEQDTAEEEDQGNVQVLIQLGKSGLASIDVGLPISLYSEVAGIRTKIHTLYSESIVLSGRSSPGIAITLNKEDIPEGKLWVVVDDDGTGTGILEECNENNNELLIEEGLCQ